MYLINVDTAMDISVYYYELLGGYGVYCM